MLQCVFGVDLEMTVVARRSGIQSSPALPPSAGRDSITGETIRKDSKL